MRSSCVTSAKAAARADPLPCMPYITGVRGGSEGGRGSQRVFD